VAFVRTKRVGEHEYRQLVENYRENGHHRQRVLAHLGHADTVEDAIEDARRKLADLDSRFTEQIEDAERSANLYEDIIREHYGDRLARYHDGEIPTPAEFAKRTGTEKRAAWDEVVPVPPEVDEYCRAFGNGTVQDRKIPDFYGHAVHYPGLYDYESRVKNLWSRRREAVGKRREYERRSQRLQERIEKLEQVGRSLRGD
jgi:chromosome segregation ATPase